MNSDFSFGLIRVRIIEFRIIESKLYENDNGMLCIPAKNEVCEWELVSASGLQ
jgi:hypothetical protein